MKNQTLKNIIKESITDYLSELNTVNEDEITKETLGTSAPGTMFEDKVTKDSHIYLVKKAMNESTEKDLVEKKPLMELIGEGLYEGAYLNEAAAMSAAKKIVKVKDALMKENVKKGQAKVGDLETQIATLKADMQKLIDNPDTRSELGSYTARLEKFEALLGKLKKSLEANSPKKEKKEDKDEE
jgi:hypothetical protein